MKVMTSQDRPIRVDWLPGERVGLTFAPGKVAYAKYESGFWQRDLGQDLDRLRQHYRVDVLVCLLEDHELQRLHIPALVEEAQKRGLEVLRLPIPDGGVLPDPAPARALIKQIDARVAEGKRVVIHCAGGLGRAGTIGGCWLVRNGTAPADAIRILHETRKSTHCPETMEQERFIASAARWPA